MEFRKVCVLSLVLGLAAFAQGCGNDCDAAADDITAKYEECGVTATDGSTTDGAEVECTDALATSSKCVAACITAASCDTIKLTDPTSQEVADYAKCLTDCG